MLRQNLDLGWSFFEGTANLFGEGPQGRAVDLPHDFVIEKDTCPDAPGGASVGYYPPAIGTYEKTLDIPADWKDKIIMLEFDGVYMNSSVSLNGQLVHRHHYGYTPFIADITDYVKPGKNNRLVVQADARLPQTSRWYAGGGIYRHVDLRVSDRVRIVPNGIFARLDHMTDGTAFVNIEVTCANDTCRPASARVDICFADEKGNITGQSTAAVYIPQGAEAKAYLKAVIPSARVWDIDSPELYTVKAVLTCGEYCDSDESVFGVRTITVDPVNGFMLNGRSIKLKGGCNHHDNGIVGAESYYDSEYRKLKIQKDAGYNAIRCAHNPPSRDMLLAADRLGMLVIDEAFDCWFNGKNVNDYGMFFESDWEKDIEAFMLRDRNHPSVVIWSTGNEIVERAGLSKGYLLSAKLAEKMRSIDPTRPITNALCSLWSGLDDEDNEKVREELSKSFTTQNAETPYSDKIWGKYTEAFTMPLDIVGYNYMNGRYARDREQFPNRVICGTESFPRGFYTIWADTMAQSNVIGDFTWTSYDYIGEAGIGKSAFGDDNEGMSSHMSGYPWKLANDADFDILGFPRPQLALRKAVWGSDETFIAVQSPEHFGLEERISPWGFDELWFSWTWPGHEDKDIHVVVFSKANEVELFVNGKSEGKKATEGCRAEFDVKYAPGAIEAVSLDGGREVSRDMIRTAGKPAKLVMKAEKGSICADSKSLDFITVEVTDENGVRVPGIKTGLTVSVEGPASVAAFGSADPKTADNYTVCKCVSFDGRAQVVLRAGDKKGTAAVKVTGEFGESELTIDII